ncbi:hypothetical protein KKC91_11720 [bacterium]|nr:hypothetical protein [bacterium]
MLIIKYSLLLNSLIVLLSMNPVYAWQLENKSLKGCIKETPLIIIGKTTKVIHKKKSLFGGVGKEWKIKLKVLKVLKGNLDNQEILVYFSDVKVEKGSFDHNQEYLWFLHHFGNSRDEYWTKNFMSVFPKEKEKEILKIIQNHIRVLDRFG